MHRFENYIDLRQNRRDSGSDISLWPSFTDIMTVILMIFMLTMIVVIIKNSDLARQLVYRQAQEKRIQEALDASRQAEAQLNVTITNLEEKLRAKEMEIILLGDEKKVMRSTLEAKLALISALKSKIAVIEESVSILETEVAFHKSEKDRLQSDYEKKLIAITEETKKQIEEFNRKFAALMRQLGEKDELIVILGGEKQELELMLARQRKAYLVLEEKYHKLIRPARSPLGKKIVAVQYSRIDGKYRILFKDLDSQVFKQIDMAALHSRLDHLQEALRDKLYVKIIIPEKSGLSYNEAWNFTRDILSRYDYYYQEKQ